MRRVAVLVLLAVLPLFSVSARADIASIHAQALPQETAVLGALDDVRVLEPYTRSFAPNWNFPVSKDEAVSRLGRDLGILRLASKVHPDNLDLLLFTGLVAHYAYNVDVDNSYESAMDAFAKAEKIAAADIRPGWFRAGLLCQTMKPADGMKAFLAIEATHSWEALPVAFWDDYMECATLTGMPAHSLRASAYTEKLGAATSQTRTAYRDIDQKRFIAFESGKKYDAKEIWSAAEEDSHVDFISTTCGVRLRVPSNWAVARVDFQKGMCVAMFNTGPYKATVHELRPSFLFLVQRAPEDQSLQLWAAKFIQKGQFDTDASLYCPAAACISLKADQEGMYGRDGNGKGRIVAFQRDQPDYPGLLLESPRQIPDQSGQTGPQFYRPEQVHKRIPGKLNYLVLLDVAGSIEEPAMKDFEVFLKGIVVE